ncbi:MAG TPA: Fur family transcriptional regulator [Gaiellaceae bacterium]|nr:Fur family transcriptional regulator [Gaiellaceae bacterium]
MTETRQPGLGLGERIAATGLRVTRQRLRVLEELAREPHDLTAQDLYRRLRDAGERIGLATVYRTLGSLVEHGVVDTLAHSPAETCYRLCSDAHHHHLVCSECHRVVELGECGIEAWLAEAAAREDFVPTEHRIEIVGVCAGCR